MKKQTVILGALAGVLGLGSLGTMKMGSNHADVVHSNVTLVQENKTLKEENTKLTSENKELKVMTDSLVAVTSTEVKAAAVKPKTDSYETKPKKVSDTDKPDNDGFIRPFKVEVPIQ